MEPSAPAACLEWSRKFCWSEEAEFFLSVEGNASQMGARQDPGLEALTGFPALPPALWRLLLRGYRESSSSSFPGTYDPVLGITKPLTKIQGGAGPSPGDGPEWGHFPGVSPAPNSNLHHVWFPGRRQPGTPAGPVLPSPPHGPLLSLVQYLLPVSTNHWDRKTPLSSVPQRRSSSLWRQGVPHAQARAWASLGDSRMGSGSV